MPNHVTTAFESTPFAITLFAHDLAASKVFYGQKLGLALVFSDEVSAVYKCGATLINVLSITETDELLLPATAASLGSGVAALYTLRCADVDAAVADLKGAGVEILNGPIDRPWGVRTASFQDPSGHTWELANH